VRAAPSQARQAKPFLIGTPVASNCLRNNLSALFDGEWIAKHRVLNARQNEAESEIIAEAGLVRSWITVATNMAGRGYCISRLDDARARGRWVAFDRDGAPTMPARIDRQLYGRAARSGRPRSHVTFCVARRRPGCASSFTVAKLPPSYSQMTAVRAGLGASGILAAASVKPCTSGATGKTKRNSGIRKKACLAPMISLE